MAATDPETDVLPGTPSVGGHAQPFYGDVLASVASPDHRRDGSHGREASRALRLHAAHDQRLQEEMTPDV